MHTFAHKYIGFFGFLTLRPGVLTFEEPGDDTVDVELVPLLRLGPLAPKHLVRFHLTPHCLVTSLLPDQCTILLEDHSLI